MRYKHRDRQFLANIQRKDITDYLRTFLTRRDGYVPLKIRTALEADEAKKYLDNPKNTHSKSIKGMNLLTPYWHWQNVDYVKSNLDKGYVFYFICSACGSRVKYLYQYSLTKPPICRTCCCLDYERREKAESVAKISGSPILTTSGHQWEPRLTMTTNNNPCEKGYFV